MDILLGICQRGILCYLVFSPINLPLKILVCVCIYPGGFSRVTNLRKVGKCVAILICVSHFLRFKKGFFFIENNIKYNFVFSNLRFEKDLEKKQKLDHREHYRIYGI